MRRDRRQPDRPASQSHDATAGLIGNTLVALGRQPERARAGRRRSGPAAGGLLEVLRHDPPVQNTRRFLARDGVVAGRDAGRGCGAGRPRGGQPRSGGQSRAPSASIPLRKERRIFTFGAGVHACPGDALAVAIARAGVERLILAGLDLEHFAANVTYRPSANARIPGGRRMKRNDILGHPDTEVEHR